MTYTRHMITAAITAAITLAATVVIGTAAHADTIDTLEPSGRPAVVVNDGDIVATPGQINRPRSGFHAPDGRDWLVIYKRADGYMRGCASAWPAPATYTTETGQKVRGVACRLFFVGVGNGQDWPFLRYNVARPWQTVHIDHPQGFLDIIYATGLPRHKAERRCERAGGIFRGWHTDVPLTTGGYPTGRTASGHRCNGIDI